MKKSSALLAAMLTCASASAQQTHGELETYNNTYIVTNGKNQITAPILNTLLNNMITSLCGLAQATDCILPPGVAATNLGAPIGTSGGAIPLMSGTNTWSGKQSFASVDVSGAFRALGAFSVTGAPIIATAANFPGIDPTGASSSVAGLRAIIPALNAAGGGEVIIPPGTYKIDGMIDNSSSTYALASNVRIRFAKGAKFVATSALEFSAWKIFGATDATYSIEIISPQMDLSGATCSNVPSVTYPAAGGCRGQEGVTGLELQSLVTAYVQDPDLYGGTTYDGTVPAGWHSNNGITTTKVLNAQVFGGYIRGFPNGGIYTVGDLVANSPPNYSTAVVGTYFAHNSVGVECKFSLGKCSVIGSAFDYNHVGIGTYASGSEPAARVAEIAGNTITHTQSEAIHCESQTLMMASGNTMIDIGYDESNALTNSGTSFFHANGCNNFKVSGNKYDLKDWANSAFIAGVVNNATLDASYTGGTGEFSQSSVHRISSIWFEGASVNPTAVSNIDYPVGGTVACTMTNAASSCNLTNSFSAATPNTTTPSCGAGRYGTTARAYDLNAVTYGAAVAGGGSGNRMITCTSTGWLVGG